MITTLSLIVSIVIMSDNNHFVTNGYLIDNQFGPTTPGDMFGFNINSLFPSFEGEKKEDPEEDRNGWDDSSRTSMGNEKYLHDIVQLWTLSGPCELMCRWIRPSLLGMLCNMRKSCKRKPRSWRLRLLGLKHPLVGHLRDTKKIIQVHRTHWCIHIFLFFTI